MNRRHFCQTALAAGVAAAFPGYASVLDNLAALASGIPAVTLSGGETTLEKAAVVELARAMEGELLTAGDDGYHAARAIWNGMHDKRPALIARCMGAGDVARAVDFARERSLLLAVRGGGHSFSGKSVCDGGMMIDLSLMKAVEVDPQRRRARIGGGALLNDLDRATLAHGLATTTGVVSHTGVGGLTLGGGFGYLNRKHGLTVDNLVAVDLVTPDGRLRRVSADEHPDLFWGLRGGGGNFGVATAFEFALHPLSPQVFGGSIAWPVAQTREVMDFYADWSRELSPEMYVGPVMVTSPEGEGLLVMEVVYAGDPAAGEQELAPLRRVGNPAQDAAGMTDYMAMQTQSDGVTHHGQRFYVKSGMVGELTPELVRALHESFRPTPEIFLFSHTAGGAVAEVAPTATAFPHREAQTMLGVFAIWQDPARDDEVIGALREWYAAIEPHTGGFYPNINLDMGDKAQRNYGPNYARLVALKNRYDPMNLFRLNSNVAPTV